MFLPSLIDFILKVPAVSNELLYSMQTRRHTNINRTATCKQLAKHGLK